MNDIGGVLYSIGFVVVYAVPVFLWIQFMTKRFRPWARKTLGESMNVNITERIGFRNQSWEIVGKHSWQQGCWVSIVQMFVDMGCMVLPLFVWLGIIGSIGFLIFDR